MSTAESNPIIVTADDEVPRCQTTLEAPEALRDLLVQQAAGLRRVVVATVLGRNSQPKLNAISISGARHGRNADNETQDAALLLIMRIVSAQLEHSGNAQEFAFTTWHVDAQNKTIRGVVRRISFAGIYDTYTGNNTERGDGNEEHFEMLRYLTAQNRHVLNVLAAVPAILDAVSRTAKGQAAYSEVVVTRLSDALIREREAVREAGEAQAETTSMNNEHMIELEKLRQRSELMDMFAPAIQGGVSKMGVDAASKLVAGGKKDSNKGKAANPLAAMGAGAKAKAKKPVLEIVDAEIVENKDAKSTKAVEGETADLDQLWHERECERLEALKDEHPQTYTTGMLRVSLDEDQADTVAEALGAEAWAAFERAAASTNDKDTLAELVTLWKHAPKESTNKVIVALNGRQQGVLASLRMAVMQYEKDHPSTDA